MNGNCCLFQFPASPKPWQQAELKHCCGDVVYVAFACAVSIVDSIVVTMTAGNAVAVAVAVAAAVAFAAACSCDLSLWSQHRQQQQ